MLDDLLTIEIGKLVPAVGLDHDKGLTGAGEVKASHDQAVIAQPRALGYARVMTQTLAQLLATPDAYLHAFEAGEAVLVPMDCAAYRRSIFLDHRISPAGEGGWRVPVADLAAAAPPTQPLSWIFHVAHCGSTLLARALDELGGGLVLREPLALRQLALQADQALLPAVIALLSRRYPGEGDSLVKANVPVNFMLPAIAAVQPQAPAVLLWSRLGDYLAAVLRSDNHRSWVRNVTALLAPQLGPLDGSSDAERAAALWIAQHRRFAELLDLMGNARPLEAERFFADPAAALAGSARLLGISASAAQIERLIEGPMFTTYSKNPGLRFDNAARQAMQEAAMQQLAPELAQARHWLDVHAPDADRVIARLDAASL
jgi:hypothetical protein